MIDFHSHILPGIDDGSPDVEESLKLVEELKKQRVKTVVASSHYYITERSLHRFLEKRAKAYEQLKERLPQDSPEILLGAEVLYFRGISRMESLRSLCVEGTNLLLLEMPFGSWSDYMVREVTDLAHTGTVTIMLAHIERYLTRQNAYVWDQFLADGIVMQSNADFFLPFLSRRKALRMLEDGRIHVLGSDCHNMKSRPPRMAEASWMIRDHLGKQALRAMEEFGEDLLYETRLN